MKIGTKLIGSFVVVAAICGIVGGIGYYGLSKTADSIEEIGVVRLPSIQSLQIVKQGGTAIRVAQNALLDSNNIEPAFIEGQFANIAQAREEYEAAWKVYEPLPQTPEETELWKQFVPAWEQWRKENNLFTQKVNEFRALDLGNPTVLLGNLEQFRGDHHKLSAATCNLLQTQQAFDGGEDSHACRFGRWLDTFETANPELRRIMADAHGPHDAYHQHIKQIKALVADGKIDEARQHYQEHMLVNQEEVFGQLNKMRDLANRAVNVVDEARQQFHENCLPAQVKANDLLDKIVKLNQDIGEASVAEGTAAADSARMTASVAVVLGVLIALAFGVVISRAITKPVKTIVDRIKDIAQGEGDLTKRVEVKSKDEVGELATWFNTFVQKVHDIIFEVAGATREVASAATQIAASSEEMAQGMTQQTETTTQVSSAVEEMSSTVVEVARKSSDAAGTADDAGKQANEGGQVVEQTVNGMKSIADVVNHSAAAINELGKRGEQIGQIIGVINDIADQTNLLALNAAIEAARAGEQGRGFAVVADEVRKLAERTTTATEEVAESIKAIQTETSGAVERMSAGTETVGEGVKLAEQAGESLKSIVEGSNKVATMIQAIAAASEQQSAASEQIARNVESINAVTKQSSEGASQAAAAASQLSAKAETLQQLVGQFKLEQQAAMARAA